MVGSELDPNILWDTLKLTAQPLQARNDILALAHVRVQMTGQKGSDEYRVSFEINRHHGLVAYDTEVRASAAEEDGPRWRYSGRRDIIIAVKERFLTTQLYLHIARQLGWIPDPSVRLNEAPFDP